MLGTGSEFDIPGTYQLLFENNPLPMWVYDLDTLRFVMVNEAAVHHYGYTREEFLAMTIKDIRPPEDIPALLENVSSVTSGLDEAGVWRHRKKDGTIIDVEIISYTITFQGKRAELVLAHDITKRKQAEAAMRRSQEQLAGIVNSAMDAIITVDSQHRIVLFNAAAEQVFGYPATEVIGQPLDRLIPNRFREAHQKHIERFGQTGITDRVMGIPRDLSGLRANGEEFPIEASISRSSAAGQQFFTVILRDTTERQRMEQERQQLLETVRDGRERLEMLSKRLVEAQETERRYIARELHDEIGQGLTAVKINLQIALGLSDPGQLAVRLTESASLVEQTLQQVRSLSLDLRPSMLDDLGLVSALRWYTNRQAERAGLVVEFVADPPDLRLPSDLETVCFRVVQEAMTNIVRHAQAQTVRITLEQADNQVTLTITDDGIGFDTAVARKLAMESRSLGVLGMEERVILAGGEFELASDPGRGSRVCARFRLRDV